MEIGSSNNLSTMSIYEELWRACAGPFLHLPQTGERVFYFPQGHLEQMAALTNGNPNEMLPEYHLPSKIPCRVIHIEPRAAAQTDEVYAQITLLPANRQDDVDEMDPLSPEPLRPVVKSIYKKLTSTDISSKLHVRQHDANDCFPPLDMTREKPSQELVAKDLHGFSWHFRHAFTGNPKRHVLTTGWKRFVKEKRLVAGDCIIFIRGENGELCVGIRRTFSQREYTPIYYLASGDNKYLSRDLVCSSWDSATLGILATAWHAVSTGSLFTVYYRPSCGISQFIVGINKYVESVKKLCSIGMRFSMRFEDNGQEQTRCNGSVIEVGDVSSCWAGSKWRCLKVKWDDLGATMRPQRVSPWEVEPSELDTEQTFDPRGNQSNKKKLQPSSERELKIFETPNVHDIDPLMLSQKCWIHDEGQSNWTSLHQMCQPFHRNAAEPSDQLVSDEDNWLQNMLKEMELPNEDGAVQFENLGHIFGSAEIGKMNMIECNQFPTVSPTIHFSEINGERVSSEESVQGVDTRKRKLASVGDDRQVKCRIEASEFCGVDSNSDQTHYSSASEGECSQELSPVQGPEDGNDRGLMGRVWDRVCGPLLHQLRSYFAK